MKPGEKTLSQSREIKNTLGNYRRFSFIPRLLLWLASSWHPAASSKTTRRHTSAQATPPAFASRSARHSTSGQMGQRWETFGPGFTETEGPFFCWMVSPHTPWHTKGKFYEKSTIAGGFWRSMCFKKRLNVSCVSPLRASRFRRWTRWCRRGSY